MIRTLKGMGLALVAIASLSMVAASAAQAVPGEFHIDTGPSANVTGQGVGPQTLTFTASGAQTSCAISTFESTVQGGNQIQTTTTELTLTPTFTGCTLFGAEAVVDMNGCKFTLTGNQPNPQTALVDITGCTPAPKAQIEITTPGCTVTIPQQHNIPHVTFENTNPGGVTEQTDTDANFTLTGIIYETHGAFCPGAQTIPTNDLDYYGKVTLRGYKDLGSEPAFHNGHWYNRLICGAQVGLFVT
jgi:hypothetical protein